MKYRVLKETPFHDVGDVITGETFHQFYCRERVEPAKFTEEKQNTFFQPIRYEKLPLDFIWDGYVYTKCLDGTYRSYKDIGCYQAMTNHGAFSSVVSDTLLTRVNNSTIPVFEIKRYEQS